MEASSDAPATWPDRLCGDFGGARQRARGGFELDRGGRNIRHDGAYRRLEIVGKADEFGAPRFAGGPVLRFVRGRIALGLGDGLQLEFLHRARHLAEFILAAEPRQHDVEIAAGEFAHRLAHRGHRARNPLAQHQRQQPAEHEAAGGEHRHQPLGLVNRDVGFVFKPLLVRQQIGLHHIRALGDRGGGVRHLGDQLIDCLRIVDQLAQRLPVFLQQPGNLLDAPATILSSVDDIACSEFSTNLRRASALAATVWSELMTNVLASAITDVYCVGDLLRAQFDRRKLRLGRVAGRSSNL